MTLVELMVVLVVLSVLTAMVVPQFAGTYQGALLRAAARQLVAASRLASSQAVTSGNVHRLRLDLADGRWWLEARAARDPGAEGRGRSFAPVKDLPGADGRIDKKVLVEVEGAPGERANAGEAATIAFHADGTADGRTILLHDGYGFGLGVLIQPATSRTRVVQLEREARP